MSVQPAFVVEICASLLLTSAVSDQNGGRSKRRFSRQMNLY
nr:hypothetical protein [uncultured bacterium]